MNFSAPPVLAGAVSEYRLRMPGPAAVPDRVRAAAAQPMLSHRGPEFRAALSRSTNGLRKLFGTANDVLTIGTSGTGAMEAALANVLHRGDELLIVDSGQFGERFAAIAAGMGARVDSLHVAWGDEPDAEVIGARVRERNHRAVVCVHNESSTGVVADVAAIGAVLRDSGTLLIVDSVSGVGGLDMQMDAWGLDIVVAASQKCLMCPPGLGFAALSDKAWRAVETADAVPRFYFDFRRMRSSLAKGETPFTPPVSLTLALAEALDMIEEEGLSAVLGTLSRVSASTAVQLPFENPDRIGTSVNPCPRLCIHIYWTRRWTRVVSALPVDTAGARIGDGGPRTWRGPYAMQRSRRARGDASSYPEGSLTTG
jgi:aspartate aminotransferase-like enzyme